MAGYNTVVEALAARKPLLLVPRVHPRREQLVRAESLQRLGLAEMLHPGALSPAAVREALGRLLERKPPQPDIDLDGARKAVDAVLALLARRTDGGRNPAEQAGATRLSARLAYG
jgi:predicted glycosyltransferase